MAVSLHPYVKMVDNLLTENVLMQWPFDTVKVMLMTSSHTPSLNTHSVVADLSNEVTGTNYSAGGVELLSKTKTLTANVIKLDAADLTFTSVTLTARYAAIYTDNGAAVDDGLWCLVDFGGDVSPVAENLVITWDAAGILTVTMN